MGFFKSFLRSGGNPIVHHADKADQKEKDALASRVYDLEQQQPSALLGGGFGGAVGGMRPGLNQPQVQLPQLQMPYFGLGQQAGYGQMPFLRNSVFGNTFGPLTQPNYGLPFVSPYAGGTPNGPAQPSQPGLPPNSQPQQPLPIMFGGFGSGMQMPGRWGIQPMRGAIA